MSLTISGATVALSPARTSPYGWSQIFFPDSASRAMMCAFRVVMKTLPSATATPRFTLLQYSEMSNGEVCLYCYSFWPFVASSAHSWPFQPETYITSSTMIGEASHAYVDAPECRPIELAWNTHCGVSLPMLLALIWFSGL